MEYSIDSWVLSGVVASAIRTPSLLEGLSKREDNDQIVTRLVDALLETMQNPIPFEEALNEERFQQARVHRFQEAKKEGKLEGELEANTEIALEMLKDGVSLEIVSKYTKMPIEWVEEISSALQ